MAVVLVIYHRALGGQWRSTYDSHLYSFKRYSKHTLFYYNTARLVVPNYIKSLKPDLVIFHYTFLAVPRWDPEQAKLQIERISFIRDLICSKALIPHDEQLNSAILCSLSRDFGVTHIFTPAGPPEWSQIYNGLDFSKVTFCNVLTGYIDEIAVQKVEKRSRRLNDRPIDIGYRSWDAPPWHGRHGQLKRKIGVAVKDSASNYTLKLDISSDYKDAFFGDAWFDFLLKCKYVLGVEGGSSLFDRDGSIACRTRIYLDTHSQPTFEEVEAAIFPCLDGNFAYRPLGPRHLEAVVTRTCQVLMEGNYGGVLVPGKHYIELKRDFSNLNEVLEIVKEDKLRSDMVERAYQDIVVSGKWSYSSFANLVFAKALAKTEWNSIKKQDIPLFLTQVWNYMDDNYYLNLFYHFACRLWQRPRLYLWKVLKKLIPSYIRRFIADALISLLGEERTWYFFDRIRSYLHRIRGKPFKDRYGMPTTYQAKKAKEDLARWRGI